MASARRLNLDCDDSFRHAAGVAIWTRFEEMTSFRERAVTDDPEAVHDMRVASRRLRAAIELFGDAFPPRKLKEYLRTVKQVADALGGVRDTDVLIERLERDRQGRTDIECAALDTLIAELSATRTQAREALSECLQDLERSEFSRLFLTFVAKETL